MTVAEQSDRSYGNFRRIKPRVCVRRLHDTGVMFRDTQLLRGSQSRCSAAGESAPCPPKRLTGRSVPGRQAIDGHHFTQNEVYPRRTPPAVAGSARQSNTDYNIFYLPFSCSGDSNTTHNHIVYGDRLEYSCSDDDDAWISVDGQYTDQSPQSVAVQPDEQCDTMSHSERVVLARTFLYDELPVTDILVPRTVPRLSTLTQVAPPAWFSISEALISHFRKFSRN